MIPEQCMCGDPECSLCYPATYERNREAMRMLDRGDVYLCMECREIVLEAKWCHERLLCQDCRQLLGAIEKFRGVG